MSDEDLIFLIKSGSKLAERVFYIRYSKYSLSVAKKYYQEFKDSGISVDDFYAVAFSKTPEAVANYEDVDRSFNIYWHSVVKHEIYDYIKDNSYTLGAKSFSGISLDSMRYENNEKLMLHDIVGSEEEPTNSVEEILRPYIYGKKDYLTDDEKLIAHLIYFEQLSINEITKITILGRNRVNYLIRNTKEKIQKIIKENYFK